MTRNKRKLSLRAQTLRNLSPDQFERVAGGVSSQLGSRCSTAADLNCTFDSGTCDSINPSCITSCCDPHTANCSNFC